jgi:carbon starvation protein
VLAAFPAPGNPWQLDHLGQGGLLLWPLFGATNQLLGGLAFLVILFWLRRRRLPLVWVALPAAFMLCLPAGAMLIQLFVGETAWLRGPAPNYLLGACGLATLGLEAWIVIEALKAWKRADGVLEAPAETPAAPGRPGLATPSPPPEEDRRPTPPGPR